MFSANTQNVWANVRQIQADTRYTTDIRICPKYYTNIHQNSRDSTDVERNWDLRRFTTDIHKYTKVLKTMFHVHEWCSQMCASMNIRKYMWRSTPCYTMLQVRYGALFSKADPHCAVALPGEVPPWGVMCALAIMHAVWRDRSARDRREWPAPIGAIRTDGVSSAGREWQSSLHLVCVLISSPTRWATPPDKF